MTGADRARTHLAVLGSPISHSKSPALHRAAIGVLGADWEYEAIEVPPGGLGAFLDELDGSWRGVSLTMPLKHEAMRLVDDVDAIARLTGAANTVRLDASGRHGFNTDVAGIVGALAEIDVVELRHVALVGAGATAGSALAAVAELGAVGVHVYARNPARATGVVEIGHRVGLAVDAFPIAALADVDASDLVVSTVPGDAELGVAASARLMSTAPLFDVAYAPWPTALAAAWLRAGGRVQSGLPMLLHQALLQVRIFVGGDPDAVLPREDAVLAAMRSAVMGD